VIWPSSQPRPVSSERAWLALTPRRGEQDGEGIVSVGMKNTYDRIKLNCGPAYGFTMDSGGSMGTIVTIRLPIWRDEGNAVEGTAL